MISSEIKPILTVFNNDDIYEIPDFQRDFVWGKEHINQLFLDFYEDTDTFEAEMKDLDGYLLGNIVLINDHNNTKRKIVIDGQQRLTTLSLLYKALENLLGEKLIESGGRDTRFTKMSSDLAKAYGLYDDDDNFIALKIEHHPSLKFGKSYSKIIQKKNPDSEDIESSADNQINEVYEAIIEHLGKLDDAQLRKFVSYIKNKVLLIVTTAPTLSKAFQLFEILNNRGKDLEPLDLIKNHLLKHIEDSDSTGTLRRKFNNDWLEFIANLEINSNKKVESSTFLKHYFMGTTGENIKKEKLFEHFTDTESRPFKTISDIMYLIEKLRKVSKVYGSIERKDYSDFSADQTKMKLLFQLLGLKQLHIMLIPFYFESDDVKAKVLDLAIRLGASVIFSFTPTNFIEKELPNKIKSFNLNKSNHDFQKAFSTFCNDIESLIIDQAALANEAISTRKFENSNGNYTAKSRDLLKFIEIYAHERYELINGLTPRQLSLEHILPRNIGLYEPKIAGFKDEKELREYRNRIGNLALIKSSDNSHLSNKIFADKKEIYAKSDYYLTRIISGALKTHIKTGRERIMVEQINDNLSTLSDSDYWTKSMIINRSNEIGNYVEKILTNQI